MGLRNDFFFVSVELERKITFAEAKIRMNH